MNAFHSCDGTAIFIRLKMKCSIQLGFASLNRTFHLDLSPHENICTIALITIHYLYNIGLLFLPPCLLHVWKVGKGFLCWIIPKILKYVLVASSVMLHISC